MENYAAEHGVPIIGPAVARLLSLLVQISGAKRIFEMGSAIGYSTIWLARAAGPKGKVFYTDGDPEKVHRAQMYFRMAGVAKRIEVQIGDALAIVKKTPGMFDVIFIDSTRTNTLPRCMRCGQSFGGAVCLLRTIRFGPARRRVQHRRRTRTRRACRNSTEWCMRRKSFIRCSFPCATA